MDYSQEDLDKTLEDIDNKKYGYDQSIVKPERIPAEDGKDIISIPTKDGTNRRVFERKDNKDWKEVPYVGGKL